MGSETIGKQIAMLRKEKGVKQEEVASCVGVSAQAVSKWENGGGRVHHRHPLRTRLDLRRLRTGPAGQDQAVPGALVRGLAQHDKPGAAASPCPGNHHD